MSLFERISILVVEDGDYMLSLLRQVLFAAGFRHIRTARDGRDAINMLGALRTGRLSNTTQQGVDIIVADTFMPIINGIDLLRWVRQDGNSPNRFMPYIMMSGEADEDLVFGCRDVGVNEILAKPFSVVTLMQKVMQVIERPRPYILNRSYFGPDRRRLRKPIPAEATERRIMPRERIRRFNSTQSNLSVLEGSTWIFDFPNVLKGRLDVRDPSELLNPIDFARELAFAQAALATAEEETRQFIADAAAKLEEYFNRIAAGGSEAPLAVADMSALSRELRDQGGTFGYPLISTFAKSLHVFTDGLRQTDPDTIEVLRAHVGVIKIVVKQDAKRENDPLAQEIKAILDRAVQSYLRKRARNNAASQRTP